MTFVYWSNELLGRFIKAIEAAKAAQEPVFGFPVETPYGPKTLEFSLDYAEYLAEHLTDSLAHSTLSSSTLQ